MKIEPQVCHDIARKAGEEILWDALVSHSEKVSVNAHADKVTVKLVMEGKKKELTVVRHGHGDYRLHGHLKSHDKEGLREWFGASKESLRKIGEQFIKHYRKHDHR